MAHAYTIDLSKEDRDYLRFLTRQRTIQAQVVDRARTLLYKAEGMSNGDIADRLDVNINTVKLCLSKYKEGGIQRALYDDQRTGRRVEITDDAVAWIIDIACQRPADLGYAQELWTLKKTIPAATQAVLEGEAHTYDVGAFGERYFSYVASFGAFTHASYATPQNAKNALGHLAYVLEGLKEISKLRSWHVRFEINGEVFEDDYIFGAVSNSTSVGGVLTLDPQSVDMNDGLLELLLIKMPRNPAELSECILALAEQRYDSPHITFCSAREITVTAEPTMEWSLDGERGDGVEQVRIRNIQDAIRVIH